MRRRRHKRKPIQKKQGASGEFLKPTVQTKLSMGKPGDKYEVEADQMADQVVNNKSGDGAVQKKEGEEEVQQKPLAANITPMIQKMGASEEENAQAKLQRKEEEESVQAKGEEEEVQAKGEEEEVQAKGEEEEVQAKGEEEEVQAKGEEEEVQAKGEEEEVQAKGQEEEVQAKGEEEEVQAKGEEEEVQAKANTGQQKGNSIEGKLRKGSGGKRMDASTQAEMERGFGADFSKVNIHTDGEAAQMSQDIGAQAFTHGNDIYFNKGKYDPNSKKGKHLLAHELTHTIQQKGMVQKKVQKKEYNSTLNFKNLLFSKTLLKGKGPIKLTIDVNEVPQSSEGTTQFSIESNNKSAGAGEAKVLHTVGKDSQHTLNADLPGDVVLKFKMTSKSDEDTRVKGTIKIDYPDFNYNEDNMPGEISTYYGEIGIIQMALTTLSDGQWFDLHRHAPRSPKSTFWHASVYNALNDNFWAYKTIAQRSAFYDFADAYLNTMPKATKSKWFKAASIVTGPLAVGAAEGINLNYLTDEADAFLKTGNAYLFRHNMKNFKYLMQGLPIPGIDAKPGKDLDNKLVEFEQGVVEHIIKNYEGPGDMDAMIAKINGSFSAWLTPDEIASVIKEHFPHKGEEFDFKKYKHREILGKEMVADLYEKENK